MSILFPLIAPPLSSTVYMCPPMFSFVPNANWDDAATVLPAVAFVPDAVLPVVFPQHFAHEQYAVILKFCTFELFVTVALVKHLLLKLLFFVLVQFY